MGFILRSPYSYQYGYDAMGNRKTVTDPSGHVYQSNYDNMNRLETSIEPGQFSTTYRYDALGNITAYGYDAAGNRTSVTDALDHTTAYGYDQSGRLVTTTTPTGEETSISYDLLGRVSSRTDGNGRTTSYIYDQLDRLLNVTYASGDTVSYTYDNNGNRLTMTDQHGTTRYQYDELNRLVKVVEPSGRQVNYSYNLAGNVTEVSEINGNQTRTTTYAYFDDGQLQSVTTQPDNKTTNFTYDAERRLHEVLNPNNIKHTYNYNENDRLQTLTNNTKNYTFTYDDVGNVLNDSEKQYTYDQLYRLTRVIEGSNATSYLYDEAGNRLAQTLATTSSINTTVYTYDDASRLTREYLPDSKSIRYRYDGNGNQVAVTEADGRTTGYHYDDANRLAQVVTPTGATTSYVYDGDGRRIKMVTDDQEVRYQYLGQTIAAVTDAAGTELARYTTTPGGRLISTKQQNQLYYFDLDRLGSVVGLRGENNNQVSMFAYDAFGEVTVNGEEVVNPFLYTGALYDGQVGLYQMGSRFYDPRIGRFITSDTFGGFASQPMSQNRYAYTGNNPVNYIDPTGHAVTAWDSAHLNDDEITELRQLTDAYEEAETAEQKAAIHARAEVIRNQYRDDDEVGRDDGYTVDIKTGGVIIPYVDDDDDISLPTKVQSISITISGGYYPEINDVKRPIAGAASIDLLSYSNGEKDVFIAFGVGPSLSTPGLILGYDSGLTSATSADQYKGWAFTYGNDIAVIGGFGFDIGGNTGLSIQKQGIRFGLGASAYELNSYAVRIPGVLKNTSR